MLTRRLLVIILLAPILIGLIVVGGWPYALLISAALSVAAWEFWRIFTRGGFALSMPILVGGTFLVALARAMYGFSGGAVVLSLVVLCAMALGVLEYERGSDTAASDFAVTLGGVLYIGWLGSYLISLRSLPHGEWWLLLVLPSVWMADAGAFSIGRHWGRRPLSPRVSPHKTLEGYLGGIIFGILGTMVIAALWNTRVPQITPLKGLLLGFILAVVTPLGDLGESMLKRQFGVKDSSGLLPGHGGMMDRIDSWLWAAVIGYYLIVWIF